jgi:hypothetical protein
MNAQRCSKGLRWDPSESLPSAGKIAISRCATPSKLRRAKKTSGDLNPLNGYDPHDVFRNIKGLTKLRTTHAKTSRYRHDSRADAEWAAAQAQLALV